LGGLSDVENVQLGVIAALIEGIVLQPTLYWKNAMAQGLPTSINPFVVYRGTGAALCNEMGQMGLQFGLTGFFQHVYGVNMTKTQEFSSATMGGALTAFFATPVEAVMIQQQRFGGALIGTCMRITTDFGFLSGGMMRGLEAAILRDAIYVSGLLGVTPLAQDWLMTTYDMSALNAGA
jgi:solute carrier family 25 citrate transporter 1